MTKKLLLIAAAAGVAGGYILFPQPDTNSQRSGAEAPIAAVSAEIDPGFQINGGQAAHHYTTLTYNDNLYPLERAGFSADFLASHYAQSRYDWKAASTYLNQVLDSDPDNPELIRRAMILNTGAGDVAAAAAQARELLKTDKNDGLAHLILVVDLLARDEPQAALDHVGQMPQSEIAEFVRPMLAGWAAVAAGKEADLKNDEALQLTTVHMYNAGLMALYSGNNDMAAEFGRHIVELGRISPSDAERAADLFAVAGKTDDALLLYKGTFLQEPGNARLAKKLKALESGEPLKPLLASLSVDSPAAGAALALNDMAQILFNERSDSSAMLFVNMALELDPALIEARLLLANTLARHGRYDEAIENYMTIGKDHELYIEVQRHIATLMEEAGRETDALEFLNRLFVEYDDIDALIYYGDIERSQERYDEALKAYNKAANALGETVPEKYWHLLYARGMAYEREGLWEQAEADLMAALAYRPDHPYLLNYLGYGWADQGLNLEKSLELIERAVALQPQDAYIRDSLGWVLYMMARYEEAIPHLEKAIELMPYDSTLNDHLGDAYWRVGRRLEARFQWERAINNADDPTEEEALQKKLAQGLGADKAVREAKSDMQQTVKTP